MKLAKFFPDPPLPPWFRIALLAVAWPVALGCDRQAPSPPEQQPQARPLVPDESAAAASTGAAPTAPAADDGQSKSPAEGPVLRWEYQGEEAFESTPAVTEDVVLVGDVMGKLYAIDRADGSELWTVDFDTGFLAAPAIRDDSVVIGDVQGQVYCLNTADGQQRWQAETDGEIDGAAAFYKENVLVASQDGKLYCFAFDDGELLWEYQTDDQIRCSPAVVGDRSFLGGCDGRLHIIDLTTGQAAGDPLPLQGPTGSTPAVRESMVIVPIMDGIIYAFDWQDRELIWTHQDEERFQEYRNSPAIAGDLVIVASQFKQVDAISLASGERRWRHTLRRRSEGSPVVAGDNVWIAASDGRLIALDVATGEPREWSFESRGKFYAAPVIEDNDLFVADDNGVVRCFTGINVIAE